jgi:opacity protein-like surface antigen
VKKLFFIMVFIGIFSSCAEAQNIGKLYGEVAYSMLSIEDTSANNLGTWKPSQARFILGTEITDYVALEGIISQGLASDTVVKNTASVEVKPKTSYGIAVRPFIKITDDIELFGRVGLLRSESEAIIINAGNRVTSNTSTTFKAYGAGVSYKINNEISAVVDYLKLSHEDNSKPSAFSIGMRYKF